MIIKRSYETVEATWLPTDDEIAVNLVIYPRWRSNGEADYFLRAIDCLSGYIYSALSDISSPEVDMVKRYSRFVNTFTPVSEFDDDTAFFEVSNIFKADDIISGKAIKDIIKYEASVELCNPSELALIWANALLLLRPHVMWREEW